MYENDATQVSREESARAEKRDYHPIVRALDDVYEGASHVAGLVEDQKLARADILVAGLERWIVARSLDRAAGAAAALADVASELPAELMLDGLARARDLLQAPDGDVDWDAVADVALCVLPQVSAFSRPLYWERWVPVLGEGAPRLPFALGHGAVG